MVPTDEGSSQVGNPRQTPRAAVVDDVRRLYFQISNLISYSSNISYLLIQASDWRDVYDGRLLTSICTLILIAYETARMDVGTPPGSASRKLFRLPQSRILLVICQFLFTICHNQLDGPQYMANSDMRSSRQRACISSMEMRIQSLLIQ